MDQRTKLADEYNKCAQQVKEIYDKLNGVYNREEEIVIKLKSLKLQYDQVQEDKEVLQTMYMHHSNKLNRISGVLKQY